MKTSLFIAALLTTCQFVCAQNTISGTVVDSKGNPVPGAKIETGNGQSILTNMDGTFTFNSYKGKEKVEAKYVGYSPTTKKIKNGDVIKMAKSGRTSGYVGGIEFGPSYSTTKMEEGTRTEKSFHPFFNTTHGYQIFPYLFVGAGVGFQYDIEIADVQIPIYADVRGYLFPHKKSSPFLELRGGKAIVVDPGRMERPTGYAFGRGNYSYSTSNDKVRNDFTGSVSIGYNFLKSGRKSFDVALFYEFAKFTGTYVTHPYSDYYNTGSVEAKFTRNTMGLRLGWNW